MTLSRRITRLEASGGGEMMTAADREAVISRYMETHSVFKPAFPNAITPAAYRHAIETTRSPFSQQLLACWLPGDEDL
ncbi:hypothetical protein CA236_00090 [Sphingomonas sp. ABOLG]|uniref:hypothetical protein n=1 Tax=Sphingomonas sp. ABOLG TaxID=1985880 RepID=UPI000F7DA565|nr:hypothetical protein [Sphingomonas sp. ABOLG]RSV20353.1 hypothetical protein CA236_00090 [Sphingomonas sp. ABOLG]